jgi:hypothetical protein
MSIKEFIVYKAGYKYQLASTYITNVDIHPVETIDADFIRLEPDGRLVIQRGYAWDGASGPTFDDETSMRASLVHDALYQLIRMGYLDTSARLIADAELYQRLIQDGMREIRARTWLYAVQQFGGWATTYAAERPLQVAPKINLEVNNVA